MQVEHNEHGFKHLRGDQIALAFVPALRVELPVDLLGTFFPCPIRVIKLRKTACFDAVFIQGDLQQLANAHAGLYQTDQHE